MDPNGKSGNSLKNTNLADCVLSGLRRPPEIKVREHFIQRYLRLLGSGTFDGLFLCLRSQSRPADFADQFGFNKPVRQAYLEKHGRDICNENFDLQLWRDLLGENLTGFLTSG